MKNYVSVCKNVIASNNKRGWVNPDPTIRISHTAKGEAKSRAHSIAIKDKDGNVVGKLIATQDGQPVLKC